MLAVRPGTGSEHRGTPRPTRLLSQDETARVRAMEGYTNEYTHPPL
jgi:hypothetical protein